MKEKKPDNVVFNTENQKYDAALKPYATNIGAPVIKANDSAAWKNKSIRKVNQKIQAKYIEIKEEYDKMMKEYEYNHMIFNAKFNFEPIVGEIYHLYERDNGETFLSIIAPNQCSFSALGSFYLNSDLVWQKKE
ncbi:DUF2452 domain-containing protein [Wenyingzhuangia sp. chi5]|uniref:DUF2452 domain-containing protein n=1 Tax=Wenyingzhuangia gilva TaxID=3057677 RepID=A0ABT8VQD1_9FLAO|nr:DUF2452 domain-containing protein [Wenyingzhuangia sp. chi5]MDO3694181.1 DUF2452 domain-containing protein [Wenyingzhuangia sp. chi5]